MSSPLACTRCGYQNQPGYQFCSNCGAPLVAAPGAAVPPPVQPYAQPPAYGYYPPSVDYDRTRQIDRTKTGLLLLLIGSLIGWIPYGISLIGGILALVGAILVILGRKAFGTKHSRNVVIAVVLYVVGFIGLFVVAIAFAVALIGSIIPGTMPTVATLEGAVNTLLIGGIVVSFITGLAQVLFTYEIQNQAGRILLFAGMGASIALQIAIFFLISPLIAVAIGNALAGGTYNSGPIADLQNRVTAYSLLGAIANLLWAGAYYLVWSRISRGEIPGRPATPMYPMPPTYPPPTPPTPPSGPAPPINPQ